MWLRILTSPNATFHLFWENLKHTGVSEYLFLYTHRLYQVVKIYVNLWPGQLNLITNTVILFVWFNVCQHHNGYVDAAARQNDWLRWLRMADEIQVINPVNQKLFKLSKFSNANHCGLIHWDKSSHNTVKCIHPAPNHHCSHRFSSKLLMSKS